MSCGDEKRKAPAPSAAPALAYSARLQRVARALENVTRVGATFASGSSERFPLPGIAFRGADNEEEALLLPLRRDDTEKIKARSGVVAQQTVGSNVAAATSWEVDGDALDVRNVRWRDFLAERFALMREPLGIAPTAVVDMVLSKLVLSETGGHVLPVGGERRRARRTGAFGTLVVVLPGSFEGGGIMVRQETPAPCDEKVSNEAHDAKTKDEGMMWRPGARQNPYDLTYAALYDHCECVSQPVASGEALCLVYDLVTTTPSEVPLFAGQKLVQQSVDASLTQFFDVAPEALTKRLKIAPDVWRNVNAFAANRHFAYIVGGKPSEQLNGDNLQIAKSLTAFCANSGGHYVLYTAGVLCSRSSENRSSSDEEEQEEDDVMVTLKYPWIQYSDDAKDECSYPPIHLRHRDAVAPLGHVEALALEAIDHLDSSDDEIMEKLKCWPKATHFLTTRALVVLPVAIEFRQIALLPVCKAVEKLHALLVESRDEALRYARRVVYHGPSWTKSTRGTDEIVSFVQIVVEINDRDLFRDLLLTIDLTNDDAQGVLCRAMAHFGWDECVDAVTARIRSTRTLRGRVKLIVAVSHRRLKPVQIDVLLDALLSLHPWTDVLVDPRQTLYHFHYHPDKNEFKHLLVLANMSSPEKLKQVVSVTNLDAMKRLVVPTLTDVVERHRSVTALRSALLHVADFYAPMMAQLRNEPFAELCIRDHCATCSTLQSFLRSPATETIIEGTNERQRKHILSVLYSVTRFMECVVDGELVDTDADASDDHQQERLRQRVRGRSRFRLSKKRVDHDRWSEYDRRLREATDAESRIQEVISAVDEYVS